MGKKLIIGLLLLYTPMMVFASSGSVKKSTVIECDGVLYGAHGSPLHYHVVELKGSSYYAKGDIVDKPRCVVNKENERETVEFVDCVDGDTASFKTKDGTYKTRFLAVDTPETKHPTKGVEPFGKEASEYTCNALKNAKVIELEYDLGSDKYDKYNRLLAWVFVDGSLLQENLIENGLAEVDYLYGDYKYTSLLQDTQVVAKTQKIGKWSDETAIVNSVDQEEKQEKKSTSSTKNKSIWDLISDILLEIINSIMSFFEDVL